MVVKTKDQEPAKAAGPERMMTHDGQYQFEAYKSWLGRLCSQSAEFGEFFNEEFDEIFDSKTAYNKTWFLDLLHGRGWSRLKVEIDKHVDAQSKAVKNDVRDYYDEYYRDAQRRWNSSIGNTLKEKNDSLLGFSFPASLTRPDGLPLAADKVEIDHAKFNSHRDLFNEYLDDPEGIEMYKQFIIVRDAYNTMEEMAKKAQLMFSPVPLIGGVPTFLERGSDGLFKIKSFRAYQLTLKQQ